MIYVCIWGMLYSWELLFFYHFFYIKVLNFSGWTVDMKIALHVNNKRLRVGDSFNMGWTFIITYWPPTYIHTYHTHNLRLIHYSIYCAIYFLHRLLYTNGLCNILSRFHCRYFIKMNRFNYRKKSSPCLLLFILIVSS